MIQYYWIHKDTEVGQSLIHGFVRIATNFIKKDEIVLVAGGQVVEKNKTTWKTGLQIDENLLLRLPDENYQAFLNHSCDPNIYIEGDIVFKALRDIKPHEELTIDYATFIKTKNNIIDSCNCGSFNCRKTIKGEDYKLMKDKKTSRFIQNELRRTS